MGEVVAGSARTDWRAVLDGLSPVAMVTGDSLDVLKQFPADSVDAVVSDPPYGLGFMGREWDTFKPQDFQAWCEAWGWELLRVLKPGGYVVAFGGTRTYHRLAVGLEDAGFMVKDSLAWLHGQGFPKSLDVSKALDKRRDDTADVLAVTRWLNAQVKRSGKTTAAILEYFGFRPGSGQVGHWTALSAGGQPQVPTWDQWLKLRDYLSLPGDMDAEVWRLNGRKGTPGEAWQDREVLGWETKVDTTKVRAGFTSATYNDPANVGAVRDVPVTAPATDAARQWDGWGTALKPAHEPIVLAQKRLAGTYAQNVTAWGCGALNISGARVGGTAGRWPANVFLSHTLFCTDAACYPGCPVAELDRQSGPSTSPAKVTRGGQRAQEFGMGRQDDVPCYGDRGGASRFFYVAKPSAAERSRGLGDDRNPHPTVKPLAVMRWLVRLVTPPDGVVLDPFMGSGTTGLAALYEGFRFIGIEREQQFVDVAARRIAAA